jgi:hypothetical protein
LLIEYLLNLPEAERLPQALQISSEIVRIKNVQLAAGSQAWLVLDEYPEIPEGVVGIRMPPGFRPRAYRRPDSTLVSLQDAVGCLVNIDSAAVPQTVPIAIIKSGNTPENFVTAVRNVSLGLTSVTLEIYLRFHQ